MSEPSFDLEQALNEQTIFEDSEEIPFLNQVIDEAENLKFELKSTIEFVKNLSEKCLKQPINYLRSITPNGTSWARGEYLPWNVDAVINEQCQKHDFNSPQQHHKVQEMNDDSSSLTPSLTSSELINHQNEDSDFEGSEDEKSSIQQPDDVNNKQVHRTLSEVSTVYSKLKYENIKIRYQLQSAKIIVDRMLSVSKSRAIANRNYVFRKDGRFKPSFKFYRRIMTAASCESIRPRQFKRTVSFAF